MTGRYCSSCGQALREVRASTLVLLRELFHGLTSLDSAVARSLVPLLTRPGRLTREYLDGHRVSQLHPLRLYLFASFLFFLCFRMEAPDVTHMNVYVGDIKIHEAEEHDGRVTDFSLMTGGSGAFGSRLLDESLEERRERLQSMDAQLLLDRTFAKLRSVVPTAMILFVPLLAVLLRLLYLGSGRLYFDHLVFALHFQTFLLLAVFAGSLVLLVVGTPGLRYAIAQAGIAAAWSPIYLTLALRRNYGTRLIPAGIRAALLLSGYLVLVALAAIATIVYATLTI